MLTVACYVQANCHLANAHFKSQALLGTSKIWKSVVTEAKAKDLLVVDAGNIVAFSHAAFVCFLILNCKMTQERVQVVCAAMTLNGKYSTVVVGGNQGKDPKCTKYKLPPFGKHKNATVVKYKPQSLFDVNL